MVAPMGTAFPVGEGIKERRIPKKAAATPTTAEQRITALKFLKTRIAAKAGKITRAEMSNEPTKFMAITITMAVTVAISRL